MKKEISDNANITANNKQLEVLKEHFPNCFDKDGAFLPTKLEALVKETGAEISREGYTLNWLGKSYARLLANENVRTLLAANTEHNAKPENANSENLLIQGDNLEVLKHLKNAYSEKVKMIYIDPPYNTGSDGFVYADDRKFIPDQLSQLAGIEEDEAKRILEFTQSKSNSHSAWLTFMFPRLYIARELLRDDGVIFISIDDNEQAQLKMLCDEVFGEENALGSITVVSNLKGRSDDRVFATSHNYLLAYQRKNFNSLGVPLSEEYLSEYDQTDLLGKNYRLQGLRKRGDSSLRTDRPNMFYPFYTNANDFKVSLAKTEHFNIEVLPYLSAGEEGRWRWGRDTAEARLDELCSKTVSSKKKFDIFQIDYAEGANGEKRTKPKTVWMGKEFANEAGTLEVKNLFESKVFETPKPIGLLQYAMHQAVNQSDIIMDFFSGSGTTAHAVMAFNVEDGGNRKCISIQLDEPTDEKSVAYKAGYKNIFEITRERIKRAAAKIKEENPEVKCDFGFKEFKTIEPFEGYLDEAENLEDFTLFEADKLSDEQRGQLMLTWQAYDGLPLHMDLAPIDLAGYTAHQGDELLYFMDAGLELKHMVNLLERIDNDKEFAPRKLVVLGHLLQSKAKREISEAISSYNNRKGIELTLDIRF